MSILIPSFNEFIGGWTGSSGATAYSLVDDDPASPDLADYVSLAGSSLPPEDPDYPGPGTHPLAFGVGALGATPSAVQIDVVAKQGAIDGAMTVRIRGILLRDAVYADIAEYTGAAVELTDSAALHQFTLDINAGSFDLSYVSIWLEIEWDGTYPYEETATVYAVRGYTDGDISSGGGGGSGPGGQLGSNASFFLGMCGVMR